MSDPTTHDDAADLKDGASGDTSGAADQMTLHPAADDARGDHPTPGGADARAVAAVGDTAGVGGVPGPADERGGDADAIAGDAGDALATGDDHTATPDGDADAAAGDADDAAGAADGDGEPNSPWDVLRPLQTDDLAALDPSALEDDIDLDDDLGAPDDSGESDEARTPAARTPPPASPGPASSRTSEDLTSASVLRTTSRAPRSGWRRMIHRMTGGTVSPGASRSDREREDQLAAIRTLVTHPRRITVLSRKGGVGKTTTALMLGQTLASERGDRIIAVDGNPDAGNLGYRIDPTGPDATVTDLLNEIDNVHRYADMRRFTTQTAVGLEVLRSDDDPQISTALGDQEYSAILSLLDRFYNLVLIDTGTGILDSAVQGILDGTDQIVLVVSPSLDAARSASQTLDWLSEHGFVGLVENAVAVINQSRRSTMVDVARIEDHFWDRCGATVRIPWDGFLEAGAETELDDLRPATREAYRHLAAAVARRFDT